MPKQACLYGSGVPRDSPLEGNTPWDFALITPGFAKPGVLYFILAKFPYASSHTTCLVSFLEHAYDSDCQKRPSSFEKVPVPIALINID